MINLLFPQRVLDFRFLSLTRFTSRADQIHIVEVTTSMVELFFTGKMVQMTGVLSTVPTARVAMLLSCEPTPRNLQSCKANEGAGQSTWHHLQKSFWGIV